MKQWYSNETEEHNIVLHQHSEAFNIGTINCAALNIATLKNAISNNKTLYQCNLNSVTLKKSSI